MQKILHSIVGRYELKSTDFYIKYNKFDIINKRRILGIPIDIEIAEEIIYQTPDGEKPYSELFVYMWAATISNENSIYKNVEINPNDFQVYYKPHFYTRRKSFDCLNNDIKFFNSNEAMSFYIKYHINKYQLMLQPRMFLYGKV